MARGYVVTHALTAAVCVGLGWVGHDLMTVHKVSPGESIAASWQTQLIVLTDAQGRYREPADASRAAEASFSALSLGLALHYDQLTAQQKRKLAPFVSRAKSVRDAVPGRTQLAVLDCIENAGSDRPIDEACIAGAVKPAAAG